MGNRIFSEEEVRDFQVRRQVIILYKAFLIMLEDLEHEHIENFEKLYESFKKNEDLIKQADYFSENKMSYLRKKVLDHGNDCIRNLTEETNGNR